MPNLVVGNKPFDRRCVVRLRNTEQPHIPELVEARNTVQDAHPYDVFSVAFSLMNRDTQ